METLELSLVLPSANRALSPRPCAQAAELALRLRGSSLAAGLAAGEPGAGPCCNPGNKPAPGSGAAAPIVPLFTVSCVTGAAVPLLHAFLAALQPARAAAGAPDRVPDPSFAAAGPAAAASQGSASADAVPAQSAVGLAAAGACTRELSAQVGFAAPDGQIAQAARVRIRHQTPVVASASTSAAAQTP